MEEGRDGICAKAGYDLVKRVTLPRAVLFDNVAEAKFN